MWVGVTLMTLQFVAAGVGKFLGTWSSKFDGWGYPLAFMYIVGVLELVGVAGLYLHATRKWAAFLLILIMAGAAYTHLASAEYGRVIHNAIIAGLAVLVILMDRNARLQ